MSIFKNIESTVGFKSSPYTSTSDRLRVAIPTTNFENRFELNEQSLLWDISANTNGTLSHLSNQSGVRLSIPTANGDKLYRQSRRYFIYTSSKPQRIKFGVLFGASKAGLRRRIGYFDADNGFYLEQTDANISVVRRTSASGSAVNNTINQSNWNVDTLDGSGDANNPSGKNLDLTKIQMVILDFNWYGAGTASIGFEIDDKNYYVHKFSAGNNLAEPVVGRPSLPLRHEIENTSATGSSSSLDIFGGSITTDSGLNETPGFIYSVSNGATAVTAATGTQTPILSIRPKLTFNSLTNRGNVSPISTDILAGSSAIFFEIIRNPTLTGATWNSVGSNSIVESDVSATSLSNGEIIQTGYVASSNQVRGNLNREVNIRIPLTINHDASEQDILTIAATGLGGSSDTRVALDWKELY